MATQNVENLSPDDVIEELLRWRSCFKDAPDNFDARLLKRASDVIGILLDQLSEADAIIESRMDHANIKNLIEEQIKTRP